MESSPPRARIRSEEEFIKDGGAGRTKARRTEKPRGTFESRPAKTSFTGQYRPAASLHHTGTAHRGRRPARGPQQFATEPVEGGIDRADFYRLARAGVIELLRPHAVRSVEGDEDRAHGVLRGPRAGPRKPRDGHRIVGPEGLGGSRGESDRALLAH